MTDKFPHNSDNPLDPIEPALEPATGVHNDAETGAMLGGLSGAVVGAAAGTLAGPVGTFLGAVAGGLLGAGASGLAVGVVDNHEEDDEMFDENTSTTSADGLPPVPLEDSIRASSDAPVMDTSPLGHNVMSGEDATTGVGTAGLAAGAVAGGLIGTIAGGPIGAVVGGITGSLLGGITGDGVEVAADNATLHAEPSDFADGSASVTEVEQDRVLDPVGTLDYRNVDQAQEAHEPSDRTAPTIIPNPPGGTLPPEAGSRGS